MLKMFSNKPDTIRVLFGPSAEATMAGIDEDNMTTLAGNLAYVSLLSLVPLIAVVFALFRCISDVF